MRPVPVALLALLASACAGPSPSRAPEAVGSRLPAPVDLAAPAAGPESSPICAEAWVTARRQEADRDHLRFAILTGASFGEAGRTYTFGVLMPRNADAETVTLLCFEGSGAGDPRPIFSEKFETLAMSMLEEERRDAGDCVAPDLGRWFRVTAVDLDDDGTREVIVESDAAGPCASCLANVRVYKVSEGSLAKVLEEPYNGLELGAGKGLVVHAYESDENGPVGPSRKAFFTTEKQR